MVRRARSIAETVLRRSPAQLVFRHHARNRLAVLAYHDVHDPVAFDRQLEYLERHWAPVPIEAVRRAATSAEPLPPRAVLVTFDDADRTILEHALPLLRRRRVPAVAFIVADHLDSDRPFWWVEVASLIRSGATSSRFRATPSEQIIRALKSVPDDTRLEVLAELREHATAPVASAAHLRSEDLIALAEGGIAIGNHSFSHPCLPRCGSEKIESEIRESHRILTRAVGQVPKMFAYPNGDCDDRAVRRLRAEGYELGFLFDHRIARIPFSDPLRISRVRVSADASVDRLATIVSGLHPWVTHARGRVRGGGA